MKRSLGSRFVTTKCPTCGAGNPAGITLCQKCGKLLAFPREWARPSAHPTPQSPKYGGLPAGYTKLKKDEPVDHRAIPSKSELDYVHGFGDTTQRSLDSLLSLLSHLRRPQIDVDEMLQEAADTIWRKLEIDNVGIGLRDPKDGKYRYRAMAGFREDAVEGHKQIAQAREQFFEDSQFKGTDISRLSRLYLAEDNELTEEESRAFNRPGLFMMKRRTTSDSLEGDCIDTKICGANDELLGWIEISGTRSMKLPDAKTAKFVEAIASIISAGLTCQDARKAQK